MEFKFDAGQEYQINAIESIARLFEGQGKIEAALRVVPELGFVSSPNRLDLTRKELLRNLQEVQKTNNLPISSNLETISRKIDTVAGKIATDFPNFTVEMETGTGKTYVYVRTALELSKRYGFQRFIVVVPSIAIKEGVLKTFQLTKKHFQGLYENLPYEFYPYDSSNLTQVRQFTSSLNVHFMVMTLASFNKAMTETGKGNVIKRSNDRLQGATPIHLVQSSRPILILDEPQNMESKKSVDALASLHPLMAMRYSATHKKPYNLVYSLSPADAYRQGLVKKIQVASVIKEDDIDQVFIRLDSVSSKKKTASAKMTVNKLMRDSSVKETTVTVKPGDELFDKTNLTEYKPFVIEEINPGSGSVRFTNGVEIQEGEARGADRELLFKEQIRYTIEEHFRTQASLLERGIKVLSLFFIDRVDNYVSESGVIRRAFDEAFNNLKAPYSYWKTRSPEQVRGSYFAFVRKKSDEIVYEDSLESRESEKDEEAYDLIMKDKERLLSFESPVAFIFSHSALREGWDNPNVFQICTLNQTASKIKKRQEVGRGIRLAVDQSGQRINDPRVNRLTVVANQSYEQYVQELQREIVIEYGKGELPPKPENARRRETIRLRKEFLIKPEFETLWKKIRTKTRYSVTIDTDKLIDETAKTVDKELDVKPPRIVITKVQLKVDSQGGFDAVRMSSAKTVLDLAGRFPLPNLTDRMTFLLENTTPPVRISKRTLVQIYLKSKKKKVALKNPFEFASTVVRVLKQKLADHLINGIKYETINEWYEMSQLVDSFETWENRLVRPAEHSVYDGLEVESGTERAFVEGLEKSEQVRMYVKLPSWFIVPTPVGEYNPDWAIVWEDRDVHGAATGLLLYLIRETKSTTKMGELRPEEAMKIECGHRHFTDALGVDYDTVTTAAELPKR